MSGAAAPAPFLEALERERRAYADALPGRIRALRELWRAVPAGGEARAGLESVERAAHGLAGSGAIFGFERLSAEARALEIELRSLIDMGAGPPDAEALVESALARIEASLGTGRP